MVSRYVLANRRSLTVAEHFLKSPPSLLVHIDVPDEKGVMAAARIHASHAIAYGDSFAIALAQTEGGSVITGDDQIRQCALVPVDWIRVRPPVIP